MFKDGKIRGCSICQSTKNPEEIRKSPEFGKYIWGCRECGAKSVRDLTHGIKNDSIKGSTNRALNYCAQVFDSRVKCQSILEIGPGDWSFLRAFSDKLLQIDHLVDLGWVTSNYPIEIFAIDVGKNFIPEKKIITAQMKGKGNFTPLFISVPKTPKEIYDVSKKFYLRIKKISLI